MARLESQVDRLAEDVERLAVRFGEHEDADERRHRETIQALSGLRSAIEVRDAVASAKTPCKSDQRVPYMRRPGVGGMDLAETMRTAGIVLALIAALMSGLLSAWHGETDEEQMARTIQMLREIESQVEDNNGP